MFNSWQPFFKAFDISTENVDLAFQREKCQYYSKGICTKNSFCINRKVYCSPLLNKQGCSEYQYWLLAHGTQFLIMLSAIAEVSKNAVSIAEGRDNSKDYKNAYMNLLAALKEINQIVGVKE